MNDIRTYQIEVQGQIDEIDINRMSPLKLDVCQVEEGSTHFSACTDQSGLIGLIRFLNSRGIVLLSINSELWR